MDTPIGRKGQGYTIEHFLRDEFFVEHPKKGKGCRSLLHKHYNYNCIRDYGTGATLKRNVSCTIVQKLTKMHETNISQYFLVIQIRNIKKAK